MEQRKITVVSTRDQIRKTFMSSAKTLGELKSEMTANGVDHEGLTYLEGLTKAEYIDDSSVLPLTVSYEDPGTGEEKITNELVFILSQPNKKIKSGSISRAKIYEKIRDLQLGDKVKAAFGRDYTRVSTLELLSVIEKNSPQPEPQNAPCAHEPLPEIDTTPSAAMNLQTQINSLNNKIETIKKAINYICMRSDSLDDEDIEEIDKTLAVNSPITSVAQTTSASGHCAESDLPKGILDNIIKELD